MSPFVDHITVPDLGSGGEFALWGFRAIVSGQGNSCQLSVGFNRAFATECVPVFRRSGGTRGRLAVNALKSFVTQLAVTGRRISPLCVSDGLLLTQDELHIVFALAAAQSNDCELCEAHLSYVLNSLNTKMPYQAAQTYGLLCARAGMIIDLPASDKGVFDRNHLPANDRTIRVGTGSALASV